MKDWRDNPKFKFTEEEKRKARKKEKESDAKMKLILGGIILACLLIYREYFQ